MTVSNTEPYLLLNLLLCLLTQFHAWFCWHIYNCCQLAAYIHNSDTEILKKNSQFVKLNSKAKNKYYKNFAFDIANIHETEMPSTVRQIVLTA